MNAFTVLLADSDRVMRIVSGHSLEETGMRVHVADSIGAMLAAARDNTFRVLLTDVRFPDGNIFNHIDEIKNLHPQIAIVIMSMRRSDGIRAQNEGFAFLQKPFAGGELVKIIRRITAEKNTAPASLAESTRHHIERFIRGSGNGIGREDMPQGIHGRIISEVEKPLIETILRHAGGNQLRAARILGLNRNTLRKKIKLLGINVAEQKSARPNASRRGER